MDILTPIITIELIKLITAVGALIVILCGLKIVYSRLKAKNQGIGPNTTKTIGVILFLPIILLLAILTDIHTETLATLLGTIAGYVLSEQNKSEE